jgi:hypothetical protein
MERFLLFSLCAGRPEEEAHRIRSGGNCSMSTFLFLIPWSALDASAIDEVANPLRETGTRASRAERTRMDDSASVRASDGGRGARARSRWRHAVQSRLPEERVLERSMVFAAICWPYLYSRGGAFMMRCILSSCSCPTFQTIDSDQ